MADDAIPVVLDNGSGLVKAGFAGEDAPRVVAPAIIGRERRGDGILVGDACNGVSGYKISYPIEHGIVTDWEAMEAVWKDVYDNGLKVDPSGQPVLLTEAPLNPRKNREKMLEVMFESFRVPALYVQIQAVLALYAAGQTTGCVVDIGDGVSHTVPITEGYPNRAAIQRVEVAGRDLTQFAMDVLSEDTGRPFTTSVDREIARQIKERCCFVAQDFASQYEVYEADPENWQTESGEEGKMDYELPDGTVLTVGRARFCVPEALFDPSLMESEARGIHEVVSSCIQQCDIDTRKGLMERILVSGGTTMYPGFAERLQWEVQQRAPPAALVNVVAPAERKYTIWIGGAILAGLGSFQHRWITADEYNEHGPEYVHEKCDSLETL